MKWRDSVPKMKLSEKILSRAKSLAMGRDINRTKAGPNDTLIGKIGEVAFAYVFFGDINLTCKDGEDDFNGIEIKCSQCPLHENMHLLVREDYAIKRSPPVYVQIILDGVNVGDNIYWPGWTTHGEVIGGTLKDFGSKFGKSSGYKCYGVRLHKLRPMHELRTEYAGLIRSSI